MAQPGARRRVKGEGSVFEQRPGLWRGVLELGMVNGKRVRKTYLGKTRKEVAQQLAAAVTDKSRGKAVVASSSQTVEEYLESWLESIGKGKVRDGTLQRQQLALPEPDHQRPHIDRASARFTGGRWTGIPVEVTTQHWAWESYHSALNNVSGITFPACAICERAGLVNHQESFDLRERSGRIATLYREFNLEGGYFNSHLLYIRQDLLESYAKSTDAEFVWVISGERRVQPRRLGHPGSDAVRSVLQAPANTFGGVIPFGDQHG